MTQPSRQGLFALLRRLFGHLKRRRRVQFALLLVLVLVSAFAEVISLGAVLPFLGVLTAPQQVLDHPILGGIARSVGITTPEALLLPTTIGFATAALLAGAVRVLLLWANTRLAFGTGADLSIEVYRRTLYQPYRVHIGRNSSEVVSGITRKVDLVVTGMIIPVLTFVGSAVLLLAILTALFLIDPVVAAIATVSFGGCYGIMTIVARQRARALSKRIAEKQIHIFKALQEGLSGIRDVLLNHTQERYARLYRQADLPLRQAQGKVTFLSQSPRYAMEAFAMTLVAVIGYIVATQPGGAAAALPTLGALALGGQRMLPALQQGYAAWSSIMGYQQTLADTIALLDQPLPAHAGTPVPAPMPFGRSVRFEAVSFRYEKGLPAVLDHLDLTIEKGTRVGLIGPTGSGKSTTIDILMGLLEPSSGRLLVDDVPVDEMNVRAWQRNVSHVPQHIYLTDASFAENIALGEAMEGIDMERVRWAAEQAQIARFIESSPGGYDAPVGENGVRLSGGQRQRIGIARALYRRADVLVCDEATSALDNETEKSVMEAIDGLSNDLTVVLIAHRLSTLRGCDAVIELAGGRVARQGTYAEIAEEQQRRLAGMA
jgi:ABC-type multidrug transport system fused ATPase/permease subunit